MKRLAVLCSFVLLSTACAMAPQPITVPGGTTAGDTAAILIALNEGEIAHGQLAQSRSATDAGRSLGQMMVANHTANLDRGRELFTRLGITPTENEITRSLRDAATRTSTSLQTYTGAAFDRTWGRTQADLHQWALNALDVALIPSANNTELRDYLMATRASIASHLEKAQRLAAQ